MLAAATASLVASSGLIAGTAARGAVSATPAAPNRPGARSTLRAHAPRRRNPLPTRAHLPLTTRASALVLQVRAQPQMADISAFGDIWGMEAKTDIFNKWDPEQPRGYDNFNPFERNDESAMCDENGCFPGQSRGYKVPNRPDQSWGIMQAEKVAMDTLKEDAKFHLKGKPGCFTRKWQEGLGAPP